MRLLRRLPALSLSLAVAAALASPVATGSAAPAAPAPAVQLAAPDGARPTKLTVGQLPAPADVKAADAPLLGWQVAATEQTAYQVQVATTADGLDSDPVWDSGQVATPQSTNVPYAGDALEPAESYVWRVRTWDAEDQASAWSTTNRFGTGPGQQWGEAEPIWLASGPQVSWTDYTVEATFRIVANNASILFRGKDANNYYMWQFRGAGQNTLAPHTRVNGTFTQLKTVPVGKTLVNDTDYRLRIEAVGSTIRTYLDDVLIDTTTNTTFSGGTIGFRTGGTERNAWDNMRVTASDGRVLYRSDFDAPSSDFSCAGVSGGRLTVGPNANCLFGQSQDWAFLRGEVELPDKEIAWASVFATASSTAPTRQYVYKMWLNGRFVGLGPTQPIRSETRYDGFDVTDLLRRGESNALGALAYTSSDRRFLAELVVEYADGSRQRFGTGSNWTTLDGGRVFPAAGSIGTSYFSAPKENLQSAAYPTGFDEPGFDDSEWQPAQTKAAFTDLQETPTAKVEQQLRQPTQVVEKAPGHYFIDYGRTWIGGLSLDVDGTAGQVLDVRFGEALSSPQTVRYAMATGNNYQDRWTLRDGQQHLETWGMRVFRYAEVIGAPPGLGAEDFPALAQIYPFDEQGAVFRSSDDALNQVWELSRNTIEATNHNLYVDSWTRERDAYEADSYLQMMANFFVSDDPTLGNYSLEYLLTGRTWPTEWPMYTILAFHDSFQQTGDIAALQRNYDSLVAKLPEEWLEASTGLIRKNSGSNGAGSCNDCDIVDWPAGERDGYVFRPYNTVINAIGHRSYLDMAAIAESLGRTADAERFTATADRLRTAVNERMYDAERGAYRDGLNADGTPIDHYAIQASVFATAFGVADADRAAQTAEYIRTRGMACSVYCAAFLVESLYNGDRSDVAHSLLTSTGLRSWMNMINKGAGATMEAWDLSLKSNTTYSHPWAASPAYNVPQGMFGIRPTTPGYATYDVRPQPQSVEWAGVTLPTLRGRIAAAYHSVGDRTDVGVHVPGNTVSRVFVPGAAEGQDTVYVDGVATPATYERGYLRVDEVGSGCHVLSLRPGNAAGLDKRLTTGCPDGYRVGQEIDFDPLPDRTAGDPPFEVSATASSGLPVTFSAEGVCTVDGTTVRLTGAGTCTITASQAGDDDYQPAAPVSRSFDVGVGILDTFDRGNGRVGDSWAGATNPSFYRISRQALGVHKGGPLVWRTEFGPTQEAGVQLSEVDRRGTQGVLLKVQSSTGPQGGAIAATYDARAGGVRVQALRLVRDGWTDYGVTPAVFAPGDILSARAGTDGRVVVRRNGDVVATVQLSDADREFFDTRGGHIGIWALDASKAMLDDFRGGTID